MFNIIQDSEPTIFNMNCSIQTIHDYMIQVSQHIISKNAGKTQGLLKFPGDSHGFPRVSPGFPAFPNGFTTVSHRVARSARLFVDRVCPKATVEAAGVGGSRHAELWERDQKLMKTRTWVAPSCGFFGQSLGGEVGLVMYTNC